jgi:pyrroline-5-carboxylate reductase
LFLASKTLPLYHKAKYGIIQNMQILMIGLGAMGSALLKRWGLNYNFTVIDPFKENCLESIDALPLDYTPDVVLIAIKPQELAETLPAYARFSQALFISIAAGVTCKRYQELLGDARLSRVMPNLAVQVGESASAYVLNENCTEADDALVHELFAQVGVVKKLTDERLFDAVTALSGSGPAYVYYLCETLSDAAQHLGLDAEFADEFARQTIIGAAATLKELPESAAQLRANVSSKGGTTQAALNVLMVGDALQTLFSKALTAARNRGQYLARNL